MEIYLFVGLGNPGSQYLKTRHNVGFSFIDKLAEKFDGVFLSKFKGLVCQINLNECKIILLKPQTFMNLSGQAVQSVMSFYKIKPENVIVFYDDLDLDIQKLRIKFAGGSGGHNGIKSIDSAIGQNYWRVRIGIADIDKIQASSYVLSSFTDIQMKKIEIVLNNLVRNVEFIYKKEFDKVMNSCALDVQNFLKVNIKEESENGS